MIVKGQRRTQPVREFDTIRWAREMAEAHKLRLLEAHVLLLLATYADKECKCYPGIKRLAERSGLKPVAKTTADGQPAGWTNSAISEALASLQDKGLINSKRVGRGQPVVRELLVKSSAVAEDSRVGDSSASAEPSAPQSSALAELEPSAQPEGKYQKEQPASKQQPSEQQRPDVLLRQGGGVTPPPSRIEETPEHVRSLIAASLPTSEEAA